MGSPSDLTGSYQRLFDHNLDAVFLTLSDGTIVAANPAACELFNMTEAELCAAGRAGIIHPDENTILPALLEERQRAGKIRCELKFIRKDGSTIIGDVSSAVIDDEGISFVIIRDITSQRMAASAHAESENRYRRLFNDLPHPVMFWEAIRDESGEVIDAILRDLNPAALSILHGRSDVYISGRMSALFPEEMVGPYMASYRDTMKTMRPVQACRPMCFAEKCFDICGVPFDSTFMVSVCIEVTERERAEEALRLSEQLYRAVFDSTGDMMLLFDASEHLVATNEALRARRGPRISCVEDLAERLIIKRMDGTLLPADEWVHVRSLRGEELVSDLLTVFDKVTGKEIVATYTGTPIRNVAGRVTHALVTVHDVTATYQAFNKIEDEVRLRTEELAGAVANLHDEIVRRSEAEAILARSEALLKTVLETIPAAVFVNDREGTITFTNNAAAELWGMDGNGAAVDFRQCKGWSRDTGKEITPDEWGLARAVTQGVSTPSQIIDIETFTGERKTIIYSASPIRSSAGDIIGAVGASQDITREIDLQKQLLQVQKFESLGALASGVAHDFNNLLSAICGYADVVHEEIVDPAAQRNIEQILDAGNKGRRLVHQLLSFSKNHPPEMSVVNINDKVLEMLSLTSRLIGMTIEVACSLSDNPVMVRCDDNQFDQVLMNIILNARDAMPEGGTLAVSTGLSDFTSENAASIGLEKCGRYGFVRISDTGTGIPQKYLDRIFDPFFTTKEAEKGTGLGLSVAYGIMRRHHGAIHVSSAEGKGTVMTILLPVDDSGDLLNS